MSKNEDILEIKIILLGDMFVGKTSIISRYVEDSFSENIMSSSAMSYTQKDIIIDKQKIQLNIWDTVGQEKYRALSKLFFQDTKIVILVYSIKSLESFKGLDYWYNLYKETIGNETILGIIGNKSDLYLEQEVEESQGEEYAKNHGGIFQLVSAKNNRVGIDEFIKKLVNEYLKKFGINKNNKKIKLGEEEDVDIEELKAGCCTGSKGKRMIRKYSSIIKDEDGIINTVFLGEDSVGKTSIINRILKKEFNSSEIHTEELNEFNYKFKSNKMKLNIKINDVNNQKKITKEFVNIIEKSEIFFLVYDIYNDKSIENIEYWIDCIKKVKDNINKILIYILANKNEKIDGKENNSNIEKGKIIAVENKYMFKTISAKENEGISGLIDESVKNYLTIP
jgi:small GTP-binding protein